MIYASTTARGLPRLLRAIDLIGMGVAPVIRRRQFHPHDIGRCAVLKKATDGAVVRQFQKLARIFQRQILGDERRVLGPALAR